MFGQQVLHHVRRLAGQIDDERLVSGVIVRKDRPRFEGHPGVAGKIECALNDGSGAGDGGVDVADRNASFEPQIAAKLGMEHRGQRIERGFGIDQRRQRLVVDVDAVGRVLGLGERVGDDGHDRLPLPQHPVGGQAPLWRRSQTPEMGQHTNPRRTVWRQHLAGHHAHDPRRGRGGGGVDRFNPGVGVRTAHKSHVDQPWQLNIVHITGLALEQTPGIGARDAATNVAIGVV